MIKPYGKFARIYDYLMCSVDYEAWADYVEALLKRYNCRPQHLVDLGCGTGSSALPFVSRGYRVTAVDISPEMLEQARRKAQQANLSLELICADFCRLDLPQEFDLVLLFQDGLNYILNESSLLEAFRGVKRALVPGGLFIFDLCRPALRAGAEEPSLAWADEPDMTLIWESRFTSRAALWEVSITVFSRQENGLYEKFQERHCEKDYPPATVKRLLREAGFKLLGLYPSFFLEPADETEPKLTFVAGA